MGEVTRRIGLSLGADLCWPICYEELLNRLDLALPVDGDVVRFECRPGDHRALRPAPALPVRPGGRPAHALVLDQPRVDQEGRDHGRPVRVQQPVGHPVDGEAHDLLRDDAARHARSRTLGWCRRSRTSRSRTSRPTLQRYARCSTWARRRSRRLPDVHEALRRRRVERGEPGRRRGRAARAATRRAGQPVMHLQKAVEPHDRFVRCIGLGPQTRLVRYDPGAPLHDRYTMDDGLRGRRRRRELLRDTTLTINAFFGWDFNSCEALRQDGTWHPIDFANACPDSQVTSLHYHFPWLVMANIRWSIFCAVTRRPMRREPRLGAVLRDRRRRPAVSARSCARTRPSPAQRFEADEFEEFCAEHLAHLDEVAGSSSAPRSPATPCGRRWRRCSRPTRSSSSPSCSGSGSRRWRDDRRSCAIGEPMTKLATHVALRAAGARGRRGPLGTLRHAGAGVPDRGRRRRGDRALPRRSTRCGAAARGGADQGLLVRQRRRAGAARARGQRAATRCGSAEPVPRVHPPRGGAGDPQPTARTARSRSGRPAPRSARSTRVAMVCRFPDVFRRAICMSGTYDLRRFYDGPVGDDFWVSSPLHFVPGLGGAHLDAAAHPLHPAGVGRGARRGHRRVLGAWRTCWVRRGIPNRVDLWGPEWHHDWPTWREMLPRVSRRLDLMAI